MSESAPFLRYVIIGNLRRDFIVLPNGKAYLDVPGGSLLYTAAGAAVWEGGIGLVGRVGEDYPQQWLEDIGKQGFDVRGVRILKEAQDLREFYAWSDYDHFEQDNPVAHIARLGLSFPKILLGYVPPADVVDSRIQAGPGTIRPNDLPSDYLDATAVHICPIDYLTHSLLPPILRQGQATTITIEAARGYMNPLFWDHVPAVVKGITAFISTEDKMNALFQGRNMDIWEMMAQIASYGCDIVVIKRGSQGQYLYEQPGRVRWQVPAYPARVLDPTGAGDAFSGGFLTTYRATYSPLEAVLGGNISSSLAIEGIGPYYALDALPGLARYRLEALRDMVRKV